MEEIQRGSPGDKMPLEAGRKVFLRMILRFKVSSRGGWSGEL